MSEQENPKNMLLEVTIPEDATPGTSITVKCPNDSLYEFTVPENASPGDIVNVLVPDLNDIENTPEQDIWKDYPEEVKDENPKTKYFPRVAGVTAGAVLGSIIIGPLITGIVVVGVLVYSAKIDRQKENQKNEEDVITEKESSNNDLSSIKESDEKIELTEEQQKLYDRVTYASNQVYSTAQTVNETLHVSDATNFIITTVQTMDERIKITENISNSVKSIDEKYHISDTWNKGYNNAKEIDSKYEISYNIMNLSSKLLSCMESVDKQYKVTHNISDTFATGANKLTDSITVGTTQMISKCYPTTSTIAVPAAEVVETNMPTSYNIKSNEV